MKKGKESARKAEFGDFQTPQDLAQEVCSLLATQGLSPRTILEPTCGTGSFLQSAIEAFREAEQVVGYEINARYLASARKSLSR